MALTPPCRSARHVWRLSSRSLEPLRSGNGSRPRPLLSAMISHAVDVDRSRAIPYSNHGVERETRLELATLTLARYRSNSAFGKGRKGPLDGYLPPTSTGIHADHTGVHADPTGVHADHKTPQSPKTAVTPAYYPCWSGVRDGARSPTQVNALRLGRSPGRSRPSRSRPPLGAHSLT